MGSLSGNILFVSDLHAPFHHPDALPFLAALKDQYKPKYIVCLGDEYDSHSISRHPKDPAAWSARDELYKAREVLWDLEKLFPNMVLLESNHTSRPFKRAFESGIPREFLRTYNEIFKVGLGWQWVFDYKLGDIYMHHGVGGEAIMRSQAFGMSVVQGHHHSKFYIQQWQTPIKRQWAMQCGFLGNSHSIAMAYGKNELKPGVVGTGLVVDGEPLLAIMKLTPRGRWTGKL